MNLNFLKPLLAGLASGVAAFSLVAGTAPPANASLVETAVNGGFETGDFTGWSHSGNWEVTNENSNTGSFSAKNTNQGGEAIWQVFAPIPVSMISELSYSVFQLHPAAVGGTTFFSVFLYYSDSTQESHGPMLPLDQWNHVDLTPELDAGKSLTQVRIFGAETVGGTDQIITYIDDVSLRVAIPEPATLALFAIGLIGLGTMRRRRTL